MKLHAFLYLISMASLVAAPAMLLAQDHKSMSLWPKSAPGEKGDIGEEHDTTTPNGDLVAGKRVIRLGNVSSPTLTV